MDDRSSYDDEDDLDAARGLVIGVVAGALLWAIAAFVAWWLFAS